VNSIEKAVALLNNSFTAPNNKSIRTARSNNPEKRAAVSQAQGAAQRSPIAPGTPSSSAVKATKQQAALATVVVPELTSIAASTQNTTSVQSTAEFASTPATHQGDSQSRESHLKEPPSRELHSVDSGSDEPPSKIAPSELPQSEVSKKSINLPFAFFKSHGMVTPDSPKSQIELCAGRR